LHKTWAFAQERMAKSRPVTVLHQPVANTWEKSEFAEVSV
jgi:hypothetical protein